MTTAGPRPPLPIDDRLPEIVRAARGGNVVLVAEPGAGKTTRVPPALVDAAGGRRVLVLEPRRLAARLSAMRVAEEHGSELGAFAGYTVRFEDKTSSRTRVRFLSEGVLLRLLESDPALSEAGVVIFDELHERHLASDMGLALVRALQRGPRPELRIVAMSATMDASSVAAFLDATVIDVKGRPYPVEVEYADKPDERALEVRVRVAVTRLVNDGVDGDVLVFLPGAREIRRAQGELTAIAEQRGFDLVTLHGDLAPAEQDRAVRAGPRPKIVLSTNVAETSLTLPRVRAVVDSGLARVARHSPWTGFASLEVAKISRASAAQRAGRAGRTAHGRALRLYTQHDHDARPPFEVPEILRADLTDTCLFLRAHHHGDPRSFAFWEAPKRAAIEAAEAVLVRLGALEVEAAPDGQTPHAEATPDARRGATALGRRMAALPLHPRLARLVLAAEELGISDEGALAAAILSEREMRLDLRTKFGGGRTEPRELGRSDVIDRIERFAMAEAEGLERAARTYELDRGVLAAVDRQRRRLAGRRRDASVPRPKTLEDVERALCLALLLAFPDRVARRRGSTSREVVFAGGGSGRLAESSVVAHGELLVALDVETVGGATVVRLASEIEPEWLLEHFADRVTTFDDVRYDEKQDRVVRMTELRYDGLVLDASSSSEVDDARAGATLADAALARGLGALLDLDALHALERRAIFAARHGAPHFARAEDPRREALARVAAGARSLRDLERLGLLSALEHELFGAARGAIDRLAPTHVTLPGGRRARVEYPEDAPPFIASRLQDFFGLREGPTVAGGAVPLVLHLLAPNQRAVQVTTDLAGFWSNHYPATRRELMRRYPRHSWPEDPRTAEAPKPRAR